MTASTALSAIATTLCVFLLSHSEAHNPSAYPTNLDCRNRTSRDQGGDLIVMSWHIHYTTNTSDMPRFEKEFTEKFAHLFPPSVDPNTSDWQANRLQCPFGPNFGSNAYKYICSLEEVPHETMSSKCPQ